MNTAGYTHNIQKTKQLSISATGYKSASVTQLHNSVIKMFTNFWSSSYDKRNSRTINTVIPHGKNAPGHIVMLHNELYQALQPTADHSISPPHSHSSHYHLTLCHQPATDVACSVPISTCNIQNTTAFKNNKNHN